MLGKAIVHARDRETAIDKLLQRLSDTHIHGIKNNISFLKSLLNSFQFRENNIYTRFCNDYISEFSEKFKIEPDSFLIDYFLISFVYFNFQRKIQNPKNIWEQIGYWRQKPEVSILNEEIEFKIKFNLLAGKLIYRIGENEYSPSIQEVSENSFMLSINNKAFEVFCSQHPNGFTILEIDGFQKKLQSNNLLLTASLTSNKNNSDFEFVEKLVKSPLHGKVLKIVANIGEKVNRGDVLVVIEAMKTENLIKSVGGGTIKALFVTEGLQVKDGDVLIEFE
jgi:3-methylcrotonyl-CoA carboxylase alpha subunit